MKDYERLIIATFDLDGPGMFFPTYVPPSRTAKELFQGKLELPPKDKEVLSRFPQDGLAHTLLAIGSSFAHQIRPINQEAILNVRRMVNIAENDYSTKIECNVLTAREQDYWHITEKRLKKAGLMDFFKNIYLNPGWNSARWKEYKINELIEQNPDIDKTTYIHFDDDLRAGLTIARINERFPDGPKVFIYVFRNLSNCNYLLNRGAPQIPSCVTLIDTFDDAFLDIWTPGRLEDRSNLQDKGLLLSGLYPEF